MAKKLKIYLAGAMEKAAAMGTEWRDWITPELEKRGYEVVNPCLMEPVQLRGLQPRRLPESFVAFDGTIKKPAHWHDLKNAPRGSKLLRRFKTYMRACRNYDVNHIVRGEADVILCYWCDATGKGAGSHAECDHAFATNKPLYIVRGKKPDGTAVEIPGWIIGVSSDIFESFEGFLQYLDDED